MSAPSVRRPPTTGRLQYPGEHRKKRRFSATARANEHRDFAAVDIQIHAAQGLHFRISAAVSLFYVAAEISGSNLFFPSL